MIDIKNIAKNLVKEAVESTVSSQIKKEGRSVGQRNLTFDGSIGSNADQLFLRYGRVLSKREKELEDLGNKIAIISSNMDDASVEQAAQDPNSELYNLVQKYNETENYISELETIMKKYGNEYKSNGGAYNPETDAYEGGSVSGETRKALNTFDQNEKDRYNTDLYQKSLNKLKSALAKQGITRDSFDNMGIDSTNSKMQKWTNERSR